MWVGNGAFESFGYQNSAYIRGVLEKLKPEQCYRIFDKGPANSAEQYHFVPVSADGSETGPAALKTAGQIVYTIWENGRSSKEFDISNRYIG